MSFLNGKGKGKDGGALVVVNRIVNTGPMVGFGVVATHLGQHFPGTGTVIPGQPLAQKIAEEQRTVEPSHEHS